MQSDCIHPVLGYSGLTPDESLPGSLRPDHEVDLITELPPQPEGNEGEETGPANEAENGQDEGDAPAFPSFYFEPTGIHVHPGDVIRFNLATPDHTVTAYHPGHGRQRRVPEGVGPFSSPVLAGGMFWLYRFDEPGVYDVLCAPHEIFGMVGRIVVDHVEDTAFGDEGRPPELTAALVFEDPALEPANIIEEGSISWDALAEESKRILVELPEAEPNGE